MRADDGPVPDFSRESVYPSEVIVLFDESPFDQVLSHLGVFRDDECYASAA